ncbi:MAG: hypothetical protein ACJ75F_07295 [Flavisolibacter sp.]
MKNFFLFLFALIPFTMSAQDSWKVQLNDKVVLKTSEENSEKNVIKISASSLQKKKDFIISYSEGEKKKGWQRFITIYNDQDGELYKQTGNKIKMKNSVLSSLFEKSKTLKVYTWSLPTDPKLKQTVRVRRVHLCTLVNSQ